MNAPIDTVTTVRSLAHDPLSLVNLYHGCETGIFEGAFHMFSAASTVATRGIHLEVMNRHCATV